MLTKNINDASRMETQKVVSNPRTIQVVVSETNDKVDVVINRPVIIGRSDEGDVVDVDLTHQGGYRLGISRQHLRITMAGSRILATDLNSRNGSKLNGEDMTPMRGYTVQSGDKLELGSLVLHIHSIN